MQAGKILVAQHDGTFVIKMMGDVRLTLCTSIDEYFNQMFSYPDFVGVLFDLSDAEGIDSTSLGLMAKLAIQAQNKYQLVPIIISPNPNITRLLDSMGFNKVFDIHQQMDQECAGDLGELPVVSADEDCVRSKIIEAHRVLMNLNENNRETFSALVSTLEAVH
ncbi:STAS domain-containing protein [Oceanicoccus sp. KOV_DT_Chl]|uniref:STAS domain-containing protein n=1 Tax=Oceanicoccus sp. KOV_DT_Chl TaxID=1904639 RepID=UPI000C7D1AF8|nr:STAS domain-containing protein [Oceanicoccus sp. KOV_DT_Chl]